MRISIVMPVHDRRGLLSYGLKSIRNSTYDQSRVEIIVVDAASTDSPKEVCDEWDARYVKIDPYRSDLNVPREHHINPCLQQNVGIQIGLASSSDVIILTSPEVVFAQETLQKIADSIDVGTSIYAKVFEPNWTDSVEMLDPSEWTTDILDRIPHGIPYNFDALGNNKLSGYFLGAFWADTICEVGGIDEQYIKGIAWEDDDFGLRMAARDTPIYREDILGVHLHHSRGYQVQHRIDLNMEIMRSKGFLDVPRYIGNYKRVDNYEANQGRIWGDYGLIVG